MDLGFNSFHWKLLSTCLSVYFNRIESLTSLGAGNFPEKSTAFVDSSHGLEFFSQSIQKKKNRRRVKQYFLTLLTTIPTSSYRRAKRKGKSIEHWIHFCFLLIFWVPAHGNKHWSTEVCKYPNQFTQQFEHTIHKRKDKQFNCIQRRNNQNNREKHQWTISREVLLERAPYDEPPDSQLLPTRPPS